MVLRALENASEQYVDLMLEQQLRHLRGAGQVPERAAELNGLALGLVRGRGARNALQRPHARLGGCRPGSCPSPLDKPWTTESAECKQSSVRIFTVGTTGEQRQLQFMAECAGD